MSALPHGEAGDSGEALERRLTQTLSLPSLPSIVARLAAACGDPDVGMRDVAAMVAQDPPLCARTLRVVNSAYVGMRMPISSIEHAATVLGMNALHNLVLQASLGDLFEHLGKCSSFDVRGLWQHSILTGRIAHELSPRARAGLGEDELELAGLLHDIGKFVLLDLERQGYVELVLRASAEGRSLTALEHEVLGFDHTEVGSVLARRWQMPETVERCIALHHRYEDAATLRQPGVAQLIFADRLARAVQQQPKRPPKDLLSFMPPRVVVHLRLQPGEVAQLGAFAARTLERIVL